MSSKQMSLFGGEDLKRAGIAKVIKNNADYVERARQLAADLALQQGFVCSDDIQEKLPPPPWAHHNVMGAVFASSMFRFVKFIKSRRPSAHGRMIRLYTVRP